jgi:hypothetical protein
MDPHQVLTKVCLDEALLELFAVLTSCQARMDNLGKMDWHPCVYTRVLVYSRVLVSIMQKAVYKKFPTVKRILVTRQSRMVVLINRRLIIGVTRRAT